MSSTSRLLGLVYAPLRQWRHLDTIPPQHLFVNSIESSPVSSSTELEKANKARLDELGLREEDGQVVVVSLDGTPGGELARFSAFHRHILPCFFLYCTHDAKMTDVDLSLLHISYICPHLQNPTLTRTSKPLDLKMIKPTRNDGPQPTKLSSSPTSP
jgi:hypothetical protein